MPYWQGTSIRGRGSLAGQLPEAIGRPQVQFGQIVDLDWGEALHDVPAVSVRLRVR